MDERNLENQRVQAFLASQPFIRPCEVMETYQQLLAENKNNPEMYETIKRRLHDIFDVKKQNSDETGGQDEFRKLANELEEIRKQIYAWCESGEFTREKFAALFARSLVGEKMLEQQYPKIGSRSLDGRLIVNEALEYGISGQDNSEISFNIFPTQVKGTTELLGKVHEGFQKVAKEMQSGALQYVRKVAMTSWLFGPHFENKIKQLFGGDITLEDVQDESAFEVQKLALSYNKRSMAEYLTTGQLPPVRTLTMEKEEFIRKFGRY